jgi:hypothetical protein
MARAALIPIVLDDQRVLGMHERAFDFGCFRCAESVKPAHVPLSSGQERRNFLRLRQDFFLGIAHHEKVEAGTFLDGVDGQLAVQ